MHLFNSLICHYIVACQNACSSSLFKWCIRSLKNWSFSIHKQEKKEVKQHENKAKSIEFLLLFAQCMCMWLCTCGNIVAKRPWQSILTHFYKKKNLWPYFYHSLYTHFSIPFHFILFHFSNYIHVDAHHWWILCIKGVQFLYYLFSSTQFNGDPVPIFLVLP